VSPKGIRFLTSAALAVATALSAGRARAAAGVAGADILKIPIEARGWGVGMAYSTICDDVGAMAYNPAGLCLSGERELRFTHLSLIEGTYIESLLGSYPLGRWGTGGAMFLYRGMPPIDNGAAFTNDRPVNVYDMVFGGYVAFRFSHLLPGVRIVSPLAVGVGIKRVSMRIGYQGSPPLAADAVAVDLGMLLQADPFRLALVTQNLGGNYSFPSYEDDTLPRTLRAAAAVIPYEDAANFVIFAVEDASYIGASTSMKEGDDSWKIWEALNVLSLGAEYWRLKKMGVRIGYVIPWGPERESYTGGAGLAGGGSFRIYTDWLTYQIDIAYRPLSIGSARQDAFSLSLGVRF